MTIESPGGVAVNPETERLAIVTAAVEVPPPPQAEYTEKAAEKGPLRHFHRLVGVISKTGGYIAGVLTAGLMLLVVADVVTRWLSIPLTGVLELSQYLFMPLVVFLALAYAQYVGEHIRATVIIDRLTVRGALIINIGANLVTFVTSSLLAVAATQSAQHSVEIDEHVFGSINLVLWPIKILTAVGLTVLALQILSNLLEHMEGLLRLRSESKRTGDTQGSSNQALLYTSLVLIIGLAAALLFLPLENLWIGVVVIVLSIMLMLAGIPIGFALLVPAALGLWSMRNFSAVLTSMQDIPFGTTASWSLTVIPMFILMGTAMGNFGLTTKVFDAAKKWMGRLPGGLGIASNFAGAGLAAASGSSIAITYSLGRVAIPEMLKAGYSPKLATGTVALSGTIGMLIPPSVVMVIYASTAGTPVGPQLLAGVIPGITLAVLFGLLILFWARFKKDVAPRIPKGTFNWGQRFRSLPGIIPMTVIIVAIVGGMFGGLFTPTEAGAVGAFLAIGMGWFAGNKKPTLKSLGRGVQMSIMEAVAGLAPIFLLLIGVHVLTRVVALSGLSNMVSKFVIDLGLGRIAFLLLLIPVILVLGMFMDSLAVILLLVPVLQPTLLSLDVNMIWFGIFLIILVEAGLVTPPIGVSSYVTHRVATATKPIHGVNVDLMDVFKGIVPFLIPVTLLLVFIVFVPEFVMIGIGGG